MLMPNRINVRVKAEPRAATGTFLAASHKRDNTCLGILLCIQTGPHSHLLDLLKAFGSSFLLSILGFLIIREEDEFQYV